MAEVSKRALRSVLRFYLPHNAKNPKRPRAIIGRLKVREQVVVISTGICVRPEHWSKTRGRLKPSALNAGDYNALLTEMEERMQSIVADMTRRGEEVRKEKIVERFRKEENERTATAALSFGEVYERWLASGGDAKRKQTIAVYRTALNHLNAYAAAYSVKLSLHSIDRNFIQAFTNYALRVAGMQNPTVWKVMRAIKAFMRWANEEGYTDNRIMESITKKMFSVVEPVGLTLTADELKALSDVDLSSREGLQNVRDLFVLQCCLGVRFGDLIRIASDPSRFIHRRGKVTEIELTTSKTDKTVRIPLHPTAQRLLSSERELRAITNQRFNDSLKEVAKLAGVNAPYTIVKRYGRDAAQEKVVPKWEAIASHAGKRTFVSLAIAAGVSVDVVMKITGNGRNTIERYINLSDEDVRKDFAKVKAVFTV